ncbi:MAG: guanylate kinase, partial [Nitrospirota bacterium]|nr:guanylate kinase [Nitrospirota bacterium]
MSALDAPAAPAIKRRGLMLVLSSPSGAGKTSIARRLLAVEPELSLSISVTTRGQRPGETAGIDYHFIDRRSYDDMVERGALLEHAEVYDHGYGTPRAAV